jgi:hypothetical protein
MLKTGGVEQKAGTVTAFGHDRNCWGGKIFMGYRFSIQRQIRLRKVMLDYLQSKAADFSQMKHFSGKVMLYLTILRSFENNSLHIHTG